MGQITQDFATRMLQNAREGKHTPLTTWEQQQLAFAWLRWNDVAIPPHAAPQTAGGSQSAQETLPPSPSAGAAPSLTALREVLRITDRDHEMWKRAHEELASLAAALHSD